MDDLELFPPQNSGVIPGSGTKALWLGGTIPYEVRNESGDWRPFLPVHERQQDPLETMACVTFSHLNCLEIQYKHQGKDINFSDRFLAKMSGTTSNGNYLDRVADTSRLTGLVLESEWPNNPKAQTWDEYYRDIPDSVKRKAVPQNIQYEELAADKATLLYHLKHAPIQVTIPLPYPNHAVTLLHISGDYAYVQDHYSMQVRKIPVSSISYGLKIVLNQPTQPAMKNEFVETINNKGKVGIIIYADTQDNYKYLCKQHMVEPKIQPDGTITTDINL